MFCNTLRKTFQKFNELPLFLIILIFLYENRQALIVILPFQTQEQNHGS